MVWVRDPGGEDGENERRRRGEVAGFASFVHHYKEDLCNVDGRKLGRVYPARNRLLPGAPQFVKMSLLRCRLQDSKFVRDKRNKRNAFSFPLLFFLPFLFLFPQIPLASLSLRLDSFEQEDASGRV